MMLRCVIALTCALALSGCSFIPDRMTQELVHNPFPQLNKVAVAPFANLSHEPKADGRQFAVAYISELSNVPGYEVVPISVVETKVLDLRLNLNNPDDVRRLAQILEVDAVVVGVITDFSPYYPPRCSFQVEWYAANPGYHPIPPGYGLPWGTPEECNIPQGVVFDAEMALAREQLKTQSPDYPQDPQVNTAAKGKSSAPEQSEARDESHKSERIVKKNRPERTASFESQAENKVEDEPVSGSNLPTNWPDPRGFLPAPPSAIKPPLMASKEPVLKHSRAYNGHDPEFTKALENYYFFRDDARFGGWQSYLQRSDDFIRFCCYLHIHEMLAARGGAGETRVVWRWGKDR